MPRKAQWPPPVYLNKSTGREYLRVWRDGRAKDYPLGPPGSPEARREYARLVALLASGVPAGPAATLAEALEAYLMHARSRYSENQYRRIRTALDPLLEQHGHRPPGEFSRKDLGRVRDAWGTEYARKYANTLLGCVKKCFRWLCAEELVGPELWQALCAVGGIPGGTPGTRDNPPVGPCELAHVLAALPRLTPPLAGLARFQLWSGCRPGEGCGLRPAELTRPWRTVGGVELWLFSPGGGKNAWRGQPRRIPLGPRAREALAPFLDRDPGSFCFCPREGAAAWLEARHRARTTPLSCGNRPGRRKSARLRGKPGERYHPSAYAQAVRRACARAGVPHWHPNQLRHLAATLVEAEFDRDAARCFLGHAGPQATAVYAEALEKAARVAARWG